VTSRKTARRVVELLGAALVVALLFAAVPHASYAHYRGATGGN